MSVHFTYLFNISVVALQLPAQTLPVLNYFTFLNSFKFLHFKSFNYLFVFHLPRLGVGLFKKNFSACLLPPHGSQVTAMG